jgi:uncharacterized protein YrrD
MKTLRRGVTASPHLKRHLQLQVAYVNDVLLALQSHALLYVLVSNARRLTLQTCLAALRLVGTGEENVLHEPPRRIPGWPGAGLRHHPYQIVNA